MSINRTNIVQHLIEQELSIIGKTIAQVEGDYTEKFSLSQEQFVKFRGYAIPVLKKVFKFNRRKAESTFAYFYKNWGLKIES